MRLAIFTFFIFVLSTQVIARDLKITGYSIKPDSTLLPEEALFGYSVPDSIIDKIPFKNQSNLNRIFPGVVSYFQDFYIRGSESYETGFFIEGFKFNDIFTGKNSFFINSNVIKKIDFYNGYIPTELRNISSGLYNYMLKSGGDKLEFEAEHLSDNITFSSDPFSGDKRLGAYFYGYNETNISLSGPLYFDNIKFYSNINYLFQRDKNPQRYPGIDRQFNNGLYYQDTLEIYLPAGIVKLNSLESFTSVSSLDFYFGDVNIRAYGIYFDENTFVERNHILQYLNPRAGLVDKNGGIFHINLDHQLSEKLSYSLSANYSFKNDVTTDEFLGDDYWSYGDSVANANAGVVWNRSESEITSGWSGRFRLPLNRNITGWAFQSYGYPSIEHRKSKQTNISLSTIIKAQIKKHNINLGADLNLPNFRYWYVPNQRNLAKNFYYYKIDPNFNSFSDDQIKELLLTQSGVINAGYDKLGNISNSNENNYFKPISYGIIANDNFRLLDIAQVSLGMRFDYFDSDQKVMIDPSSPEKTINYATGKVNPNGLKTVGPYKYFSPKLLVSSSVINKIKLFLSYSQNVQAQPLSNTSEFVYSGHPLMIIPNSSFVGGTLKPILTKIFELGVSIPLLDNSNFNFTYFNKRTSNRQTLDLQLTSQASPFGAYYYFSDEGELNVSGLTFSYSHGFKNLNFIANFNYQNANELVNHLEREDWITIFRNVNKETLKAEKSNNIFFNILFAYDFSILNKVSDFFSGLEFSGLLNYQSGHPIRQLFRSNYSTFQTVPEKTPSITQIDLKLAKQFNLYNNINLDFYIYVINLLDTKNIFDVFPTTGSVDNDGYDIHGLVQIYGPQARDLHSYLNVYNPDNHQQTFYGPPRQIGFGIKLNY